MEQSDLPLLVNDRVLEGYVSQGYVHQNHEPKHKGSGTDSHSHWSKQLLNKLLKIVRSRATTSSINTGQRYNSNESCICDQIPMAAMSAGCVSYQGTPIQLAQALTQQLT